MKEAKFSIGQIIHHQKFNYRGVIFDVDPIFSLTNEWYEEIAKSKPPKDTPWYHVLKDNSEQTTYVAEQNLTDAKSILPINHPLINYYFDNFLDGKYSSPNINN